MNSARFAGDLDAALQAIRESRTIAEKVASPDDHTRTLTLAAALWREGLILGELNGVSMDRPNDAMPLFERAFGLADDLARRDPSDYTSRSYIYMSGGELGDLLRANDPRRGLAVYDATRQRLAEVKDNPKSRRDEAGVLANSSYPLRRLGRFDESKQRIDAALAMLQDVHHYPAKSVVMGESIDMALRALGDHYADAGQTADAIRTYEDLLEKVKASNPQPETDLRHANSLSRIYVDLANLYRRTDQSSKADTLDQQREALWRGWDKKLPNNAFVQRHLAATRGRGGITR